METLLAKWDNGNDHRAYKMAITENILGKLHALPLGWNPKDEWEEHLIETINKNKGFNDLQGFQFELFYVDY